MKGPTWRSMFMLHVGAHLPEYTASLNSPPQHETLLLWRGFGGLEVACWPLVPKFAGSNPVEAVGFFRAKKILGTPSFGREVKLVVPYRRFTACKRSLNVTWKSGIFRQNSSAISRPNSSSFHYYGLWWRHLAVQVGKTKDQGLYNKPSAAVHPGALAAGTLPQYNCCDNRKLYTYRVEQM